MKNFFKKSNEDGLNKSNLDENHKLDKTEFMNNAGNIDSNKTRSTIIDRDIIKYVIDNFPSMSVEIKNSLINLSGTLENTIDYIEDKSSYIVKTERDFRLSEKYRNTSMAIYDFVQDLSDYVAWMNEESNKKENTSSKKISHQSENDNFKLNEELLKEVLVDGKESEIYEDFSLKEPKAFKLGNNLVKVDDWNDLLVKLAEVLTKNYKNNKNKDISVNNKVKIVEKKSVQNELRDSAIDMLNEYKISFNKFKVIVRTK